MLVVVVVPLVEVARGKLMGVEVGLAGTCVCAFQDATISSVRGFKVHKVRGYGKGPATSRSCSQQPGSLDREHTSMSPSTDATSSVSGVHP